MKKYFIVSDTHSFYEETRKALRSKGFSSKNPEHILILCGDACDRGNESEKLVNFLYKLHEENRLIFIKGNHESLFQQLMRSDFPGMHDFSNGTMKTFAHLQKVPCSEHHAYMLFSELQNSVNRKWLALMASAIYYYETENHIFVHGWIPVMEMERGKYLYDPNWRTASKSEWELALWINGMAAAEQGVLEPEKTIVCGHWHSSYGNVRREFGTKIYNGKTLSELEFSDNKYFKPFYDNGIIALDACTAHTGFVNCIVLSEDEI